MRKALCIGGLIVLALAVIGVAAGLYYLYSPNPDLPKLSSSIRQETLSVGDRQRNFLIYIPASLPPGSPLVIVLHGSAMDSAMMRRQTGYQFDRLADERKYALVYPDGYEHNWNDCRKDATFPAKVENIDDMGFINALIARLRRENDVDPERVFLFGYSNGGHMAFRAALERPDKIAAIAAAGASLPVPEASSCPQNGPTSRAMVIDGTDDPINPFSGGVVTLFGFGSRGLALSARQTAQAFAERNGVKGAPTVTRIEPTRPDDPTWVDQTVWSKDGVSVVMLEAVNGGGHVVPQPAYRFPRLLGRTTSAINAPKTALDFFGIAPSP